MWELLQNPYFVMCAMALIIFLVTQLLKMPIKFGTKHIKNQRVRKMVNATILLIPFGLGVLADFLYSTYVTQTAFTIIAGLGYGTAGISLYGVVERFFKVKLPNPYDTEEGKLALQLVEDAKKDLIYSGKISLKKASKSLKKDRELENL